jgi:hypothetical protein
VGVVIFIITSVCAFAIMRALRDKDPVGTGATSAKKSRGFKKGAARV